MNGGQMTSTNSICFRDIPIIDLTEILVYQDITTDSVHHVMSDLLGDGHSGHKPQGTDLWRPGHMFESMHLLLSYHNELPVHAVDALFYRGMRNAVFTYDKIKFGELFISQKNASLNIFFESIKSITGLDPLEPNAWNAKSVAKYPNLFVDEIKLIAKIFAMPEFPSELLTRFCSSHSPDIRRVASTSPGCPKEGKVIAALMG